MPLTHTNCVGGKNKGGVVGSEVFVFVRTLVRYKFGVPLFDKNA